MTLFSWCYSCTCEGGEGRYNSRKGEGANLYKNIHVSISGCIKASCSPVSVSWPAWEGLVVLTTPFPWVVGWGAPTADPWPPISSCSSCFLRCSLSSSSRCAPLTILPKLIICCRGWITHIGLKNINEKTSTSSIYNHQYQYLMRLIVL